MHDLRWEQILLGVLIGAVVGIGGTFLSLSERIARLEGQLASNTVTQKPPQASTSPMSTVASSVPDISPEKLVDIIKAAQKKHVKERGELAHQAFTDDDLRTFRENKGWGGGRILNLK